MLTALDSLDFAAKAARDAGDQGPLAKGVSAAISQFLDVLKRHGVTRIEAKGEKLDPHKHQAMVELPSDAEPGTIIETVAENYANDGVLRGVIQNDGQKMR